MAWTKEEVAERAAKEIKDGEYIILAAGVPQLVKNYIPQDSEIIIVQENGRICTKSNVPATAADEIREYECFLDSATVFSALRRGRIDTAIVEAFEIAQNGDIANWVELEKEIRGIKSNMDIATGARRVIVVTEHNKRDGNARLVAECQLPLTAPGVVDMVITELGVFEVKGDKFLVSELADGVIEGEILARTDAKLDFPKAAT